MSCSYCDSPLYGDKCQTCGGNAPSNANTSGLEVVRLEAQSGGPSGSWFLINDPDDVAFWEEQGYPVRSLVTATSAQARIAELRKAYCAAESDAMTLRKRATAAEARADRLARFGQHTNWELSFCYLDGEEEDGCWVVHSVNGGRNDREWTLIGRGETPLDAALAALQQETQP